MLATMPATQPRVQFDSRSADSSDRSILVIDDNPNLRTLIRCILETDGLAVETAGDGFQGLESARSRRPSLVILDLTMPVLNGESVARELRDTYGPTLPVVVVSGNDDVQEVASRIGALGWLAKPFTVAALQGTVRRALGSTMND